MKVMSLLLVKRRIFALFVSSAPKLVSLSPRLFVCVCVCVSGR